LKSTVMVLFVGDLVNDLLPRCGSHRRILRHYLNACLPLTFERLLLNPVRRIRRKQPISKLPDMFMKSAPQFGEDLLNFTLIYRGHSLGAQSGDLFLKAHGNQTKDLVVDPAEKHSTVWPRIESRNGGTVVRIRMLT
jgi:hypothetical protein